MIVRNFFMLRIKDLTFEEMSRINQSSVYIMCCGKKSSHGKTSENFKSFFLLVDVKSSNPRHADKKYNRTKERFFFVMAVEL